MQTIGERLEEARKRKGVSIREAAEATKIRGDYLQKFESNQFDLGLAELYVRGFLRSYAQFLKLPAEKIVNDFNGLGLAGNARPRSPSREVYGRMDLSVATAEDGGPAESPAAAPEAEPAQPRRSPSSFTRGGGSNLPEGPMINPALVLKGGLALGLLLLVLLIVWVGRSIFSGGHAASAAAAPARNVAPAAAPAPADNKAVITALDYVSVRVWAKNDDATASYGEELLPTTVLKRGETATFTKNGPVYIWASQQESIQISYSGNRFSPGAPPNNVKGARTVQIP
ncbi:MAG TPA: helix-turn-helix domain-containing protein [Opitutaceae bacterium]|nr:helix-turn-helix domain-containing protein [Opitutaceae bacterium]